ncbi:hypothetical protein ODZ83_04380 [Acaricomes phytoseiuli]|uniref:hypothetical protein n=1 Tax=Acaricomes phytoseiuli TaxID=291968 RepID=UPI0003723BC4|nr:hypothetical protein [Acaricomes phytoseiuli]MCW1249431.1 hypothetical protein [Acaricomes phytoseiuli]
MTDPAHAPAVTATSAGDWPGADAIEAARISLGELGDPHLPCLPTLPDRGPGTEPLGRTAALLTEMPVEQQSYGWRLTSRPGADLRRTRAALTSDINAFADAVGELSTPPPQIKIRFTGPLSLSAGLYLPAGERVLADPGARKELAESLADGVSGYLSSVQAAAPKSRLIVQVDEPEAMRVLHGELPTVSGYQRLRRVPVAQARQLWSELLGSLRNSGAEEVILQGTPDLLQLAGESGFETMMFPEALADQQEWENLAAWIEAGHGLVLGLRQPPEQAGPEDLQGVAAQARDIWRSWRSAGLGAEQLNLRLADMQISAQSSTAQARASLRRVTSTAEAVTELALS